MRGRNARCIIAQYHPSPAGDGFFSAQRKDVKTYMRRYVLTSRLLVETLFPGWVAAEATKKGSGECCHHLVGVFVEVG